MTEDRCRELGACKAAQKAVEDFDHKHAAKAAAIKQVAKMLTNGGWGSIRFEDERRVPLAPTRTASGAATVSRTALRGDQIETIVMERRRLYQEWERAYAAVPVEIRASAPAPGRETSTMLRDSPRRG